MQPDRVWVGGVKTLECTKRFRIVSGSCVVDHRVVRLEEIEVPGGRAMPWDVVRPPIDAA